MALFKRFSNLVTADMHAVLDLMEDPLNQLKQAVRDMQTALEQQTLDLQNTEKRLIRLRQQQIQFQQQQDKIITDLDLCFDSKNLELAKVLVKNKLYNQKRLEHLSVTEKQLQEQSDTQKKQLRDNQARLDTMQKELEIYRQTEDSQDSQNFNDSEFLVSDTEVEVAMLSELKARSAS